MYTVTDEELLAAMEFLWGRMKIVVEPTGALATAGLLQQPQRWRGRRIGVIISGGNVDLGRFARLRLE
jgi:threonine dehydratase